MKVTFSMIKTQYCCNDGEPCKSRCVAIWDIVNWDTVAKANFNSLSQPCMQTNSFGKTLCSSAAVTHSGKSKAVSFPFFSFMCLAFGSVTFLTPRSIRL